MGCQHIKHAVSFAFLTLFCEVHQAYIQRGTFKKYLIFNTNIIMLNVDVEYACAAILPLLEEFKQADYFYFSNAVLRYSADSVAIRQSWLGLVF
jgi:hypothetical protein